MMKIRKGYPPNIDKIREAFKFEDTAVFCWGDIIYNPSDMALEEHVVVHEMVHCKQQGDDIEGWWEKYLTDKMFRLQQEKEAYIEQWRYAKPLLTAKGQQIFLDVIASQLSGDMYGRMVDYHQAHSMIRNGVK